MSLRSDTINFEEYWPSIENLILNILHQRYKNISHDLWQTTFFDIYKICVAQPESLVGILYLRLKTLLTKHVQELCQFTESGDNRNLLETYHNQWIIYKAAAEYLDKLFSYLNTQHLKRMKKSLHTDSSNETVCAPGLEVKDLCLFLWNLEMIVPLKKQLVNLLLNDIESERKGMTVNQTYIKGVIHSFAEVQEYKKEDTLDLYCTTFEKPFLKSTGDYYRAEAARYRDQLDCSSYMKKVLQIINIETLRCTKFLHSSSTDKVISEIRARMVADHSKFLHKESEHMVASDSWQDLHAMYKLLKPIESGLKTLIQQIQQRITYVGLEAIKEVATSENPPKAFVDSFIQVYRKHSDLIANIFSSDQLFVGALDKACSAIINHRINPLQPCKSPELLAKYCDNLLRKPSGTTNFSENEIDEKLALSIIVFKYIDDKDIFQKFYSKNMARRLIFSQSASMEAEESMINKLKQVCGYEFTAKLHRMFTDIGVSNELKELFNHDLRQKNTQLGISFSVYVLQAGSWPLGSSPGTSFVLPKLLSNCVQAFESYYYSRFNGRVLTWLYHHCTADLRLCYTSKRQYSVTMQTFHASILLLFELNNELTYGDIAKATQLSEDQLSKHIQGLLEVKLLVISPDTSSYRESDCATTTPGTSHQYNHTTSFSSTSVIAPNVQKSNSDDIAPKCNTTTQQYSLDAMTKIKLNFDFTSKRTKFKIAFVQKETHYHQIRDQNESEHTQSSIDEDRKLYIQAAIVRVMKSRKSAKHNQLIQEVIGLVKNHFTPSVPLIKKCIEILIEKQYLERKTDTSDEYKYVA